MNEIEIVQKRAECLEQIAKLQEQRAQLLEGFEKCTECEKRGIDNACPHHEHVGEKIKEIDTQIEEIDGSMPISREDIEEFSRMIHQELH